MKPSERIRLYWLMRNQNEECYHLAYDILYKQEEMITEQNYPDDQRSEEGWRTNALAYWRIAKQMRIGEE